MPPKWYCSDEDWIAGCVPGHCAGHDYCRECWQSPATQDALCDECQGKKARLAFIKAS